MLVLCAGGVPIMDGDCVNIVLAVKVFEIVFDDLLRMQSWRPSLHLSMNPIRILRVVV